MNLDTLDKIFLTAIAGMLLVALALLGVGIHGLYTLLAS